MATEWFYSRGGQRFGPYTDEQLRQLATASQILPTDYVWKQGLAGWMLARNFAELFEGDIVETVLVDTGAAGESVALNLSGLALRGVCEAMGGTVLAGVAGNALEHLHKCLFDQSKALAKALSRANSRAWRTLELALAEESFWGKVRQKFTAAEDQGMMEQVRSLLNLFEQIGVPDQKEFRRLCLKELRDARGGGKLTGQSLKIQQLAEKSVDFTRFDDPHKLVQAEWQMVEQIAGLLKPDCPNLAFLLAQRPADGPPLLVLAVRYYFRREVEENQQLFQGLAFSHLENLTKSQQEGFEWLARHGKRMEEMLAELQETVKATHEVAKATHQVAKETHKTAKDTQEMVKVAQQAIEQTGATARVTQDAVKDVQVTARATHDAVQDVQVTAQATHDAVRATQDTVQATHDTVRQTGAAVTATQEGVLRIEEELRQQGPQFQQMYQVLMGIQKKLDLQDAQLKPGVSVSIRSDDERREVKAFLSRFRSVPAEERQARPALLNAVAQLEAASGDIDAADKHFREVATLVSGTAAEAEAHFNRYLSHLEAGRWASALEALRQAASADPERFSPFPLHKYEPRSILGAGGFGVAFLCENVNTGAQVVLKTVRTEGTGMDVRQVLREARTLGGLRHPAIIQLFDCDFADRAQTRAYMVMEYFDPQTLEKLIASRGALPYQEFLPLAVQMAEGFQAAHERGVLHRDIKPANVLVRQEGATWQARLIDFGLAVRQGVDVSKLSTVRDANTATGSAIAGTVEYGAPEQMGRLPGVKVGPYSDVYAFGKTCCQALFKTTQPLPRHFRGLPEALADLIQDCLEETPAKRPQSFAEVLRRLREAAGGPGAPAGEHFTPVELLDEVELVADEKPAGNPWYCFQNGRQCGPYPEAVMLHLIAAGQVRPGDMVWQPGLTGWVAASTVPALFPRVVVKAAIPTLTATPARGTPASVKPALPTVTPAQGTPALTVTAVPTVTPAQGTPVRRDGFPSWLGSTDECADATHRYWLSGKCNDFAPNYQQIARSQPVENFLQDVKNALGFFADHDLPLFRGEVWVGGSVTQTMRVTTYRLVLTTPDAGVMVFPLKDVTSYTFKGAAGTLRGILMGSEVEVRGTFGTLKWTGEQLVNLHFPVETYVEGARALRQWRSLPPGALPYLKSRLSSLRGVPD